MIKIIVEHERTTYQYVEFVGDFAWLHEQLAN